ARRAMARCASTTTCHRASELRAPARRASLERRCRWARRSFPLCGFPWFERSVVRSCSSWSLLLFLRFLLSRPLFRAGLDAVDLMAPEFLVHFGPVMHRLELPGV